MTTYGFDPVRLRLARAAASQAVDAIGAIHSGEPRAELPLAELRSIGHRIGDELLSAIDRILSSTVMVEYRHVTPWWDQLVGAAWLTLPFSPDTPLTPELAAQRDGILAAIDEYDTGVADDESAAALTERLTAADPTAVTAALVLMGPELFARMMAQLSDRSWGSADDESRTRAAVALRDGFATAAGLDGIDDDYAATVMTTLTAASPADALLALPDVADDRAAAAVVVLAAPGLPDHLVATMATATIDQARRDWGEGLTFEPGASSNAALGALASEAFDASSPTDPVRAATYALTASPEAAAAVLADEDRRVYLFDDHVWQVVEGSGDAAYDPLAGLTAAGTTALSPEAAAVTASHYVSAMAGRDGFADGLGPYGAIAVGAVLGRNANGVVAAIDGEQHPAEHGSARPDVDYGGRILLAELDTDALIEVSEAAFQWSEGPAELLAQLDEYAATMRTLDISPAVTPRSYATPPPGITPVTDGPPPQVNDEQLAEAMTQMATLDRFVWTRSVEAGRRAAAARDAANGLVITVIDKAAEALMGYTKIDRIPGARQLENWVEAEAREAYTESEAALCGWADAQETVMSQPAMYQLLVEWQAAGAFPGLTIDQVVLDGHRPDGTLRSYAELVADPDVDEVEVMDDVLDGFSNRDVRFDIAAARRAAADVAHPALQSGCG